jgi:hypothetical protein
LNLSKKFQEKIDWNYNEYGKLWTYNLNYFEYLKNKEDLWLIYDFIDNIESVKDGLEPFPISLRGINWIKFLTNYQIQDNKIDNSLYAQYNILLDKLEYHLLGNHLLENGFSLLFGAYYFKDNFFYKKAKKILLKELEEQILNDGAHFELSPMYHQLMLFRVLDCINLIQNNNWKNEDLFNFFEKKAAKMLGFLKKINYENGDIPHFNDSTNEVAPGSTKLFEYALRLNLLFENVDLKESGYRKIKRNKYECVVDVGAVGPDYIPGHAHADTFNFEMRINGEPFIVDTGISTYEKNERRYIERKTSSHNTVDIFGLDSSEVWGGFRVGGRAEVFGLIEDKDYIQASHNGYKRFGIYHTRKWIFCENRLKVNDVLNTNANATASLHFHPMVSKEAIMSCVNFDSEKYRIKKYYFASGFNKTTKGIVLEIDFSKELNFEIIVS